MRRGAFPGTFNPPTTAHLAIVEAARAHHRLDRVDLVVSRVPLGKAVVESPSLDERVEVLERIAARVRGIGVVVSERRLVADLAEGYDVVVMGADKWHQIHDVAFYGGSTDARDAALARLPPVALFHRAGSTLPADLALPLDRSHLTTSSTLARAGASGLMAPEARDSGLWP